jgi:hypothetical protein
LGIFDPLWGGVLEDVSFDVARHAIVLRVRVTTGGAEEEFTIRCSGVSQFIVTADILDPWDYVEFTAAEAWPLDDGRYRLEITTWTDESNISIICTAITLNERPVYPGFLPAR